MESVNHPAATSYFVPLPTGRTERTPRCGQMMHAIPPLTALRGRARHAQPLPAQGSSHGLECDHVYPMLPFPWP